MNIQNNISIVIPVLNERDSIKELFDELSDCLKSYPLYEIIFIDDGSDDDSFEILQKIADIDSSVSIIRLYKNYGKADALSIGFHQAKGDIIITMDSDLQDDPYEIPNLINKINEGWDLVSGWKRKRKDPLTKRIPSKIFNFITRILTGLNIHDFNCGIKAYRRTVVNTLDIYGGLYRYIPAIAEKKGFSVTEIEVNHRSRKYGTSKYGGKRLFHGFFDLLTMLFTSRYFNRPLHFFGSIGLFILALGLIINIYLTIGWLNGIWISNRPMFFLGILFIIIGIQFFSIGLLGELFINNAKQSEKKVRSIYNKNHSY